MLTRSRNRLPNIELAPKTKTQTQTQTQKSVDRGLTVQGSLSKFSSPSKFPFLCKDSKEPTTSDQQPPTPVNCPNSPSDYFHKIPHKYSSHPDILRLFRDFRQMHEGAVKYYSNYRLYQMQQMTKKSHHVLLPEVDKENHRILLFLDLDETMVHSDTKRNAEGDVKIQFVSSLAGQGNQKSTIFVSIRPHLREFLERIQESGRFEVGVFTAGSKGYAQAILNHLDPDKIFFSHRFFREHCVQLPECLFAKDLRIFKNRSIERMVLVDNSPFCFANRKNGIPILSYEGNPNDRELLDLYDYLISLSTEPSSVLRRNHEHFSQPH